MTVDAIIRELVAEVERADRKYGPFEAVCPAQPARARLAIACLEDEVAEALEAWHDERWKTRTKTREEIMQVAAVAIRALRDAL